MAHKTYIREIENAKTAVLFIHGFLGSTEHFTEFISVVPEDCTIYNILLEGHGGSVKDFSNASMEKWKKQADTAVLKLIEKHEKIIIVAHSMGTFFAMEAAIKYPEKVKAIFLLGSPLKIGVKPTAFLNTLKSFFNLIPENDLVGKAYKNSHSIKLDKRIWLYIGWIPRYLELFSESAKGRKTINEVNVKCLIFQSGKDELVSMKSIKYIPKKENIKLEVLKNSRHFMYSEEDFSKMLKAFSDLF